jgi:hypothetical protein
MFKKAGRYPIFETFSRTPKRIRITRKIASEVLSGVEARIGIKFAYPNGEGGSYEQGT